MTRFSVLRALLTAACVTSLAVTAVPASAAPAACSTKADLPARVSIDRDVQVVVVPLVDTCRPDYAAFDIYGPDGLDDYVEYYPQEGDEVAGWIVVGEMPPGVYRTRDGASAGSVYDSTVLKYGSRARLAAQRSGRLVTLTACATQYNGVRDAFLPWRDHKVTIQRLESDGKTWTYLSTATTESDGCLTVRTNAPSGSTFRATTWEAPKVFSRTSAPVRT